MDPISNPSAYNSITLNGVRWPPAGETKVELEGAADVRKWDQVAGQGTSGATIKYNGDGLAEFTLRFFLWEPRYFDYFESYIRPLFKKPAPRQKPKAIEVEYPELAKLQLRRFVITNIAILETVDDTGLYAYPVSFLQFRPAKPVQVLKPSGTGDDSKPPAGPQKDVLDEKIDQLLGAVGAEGKKFKERVD